MHVLQCVEVRDDAVERVLIEVDAMEVPRGHRLEGDRRVLRHRLTLARFEVLRLIAFVAVFDFARFVTFEARRIFLRESFVMMESSGCGRSYGRSRCGRRSPGRSSAFL